MMRSLFRQSKIARRRTAVQVVALALAAGFMVLYGPAAAQDQDLAQQLQRLRRELNDLQSYVYSGRTPPREAAGGGVAAGSGDAIVNLQVGVQSLQDQMRSLTGRIEEVEHRLATISDRLDRLSTDIDVRFRELEGGEAGISRASPDRRSAADEQPMTAVAPRAEGRAPSPPSPTAGAGREAESAPGLAPGQQLFGTLSSTGGAQAAQPARPPEAGAASGPSAADLRKPEDSQVAALTSGEPKEQYDYAFSLLQKRELDKAATAFRTFVERNPSSPLASNAMYWLGETHYFRNDYNEAARVFLDGYQKYPKGSKAPDNLYKLGMSLAAVNEKNSACAAFKRLMTEFAKGHARLISDAKSEMDRIGCS